MRPDINLRVVNNSCTLCKALKQFGIGSAIFHVILFMKGDVYLSIIRSFPLPKSICRRPNLSEICSSRSCYDRIVSLLESMQSGKSTCTLNDYDFGAFQGVLFSWRDLSLLLSIPEYSSGRKTRSIIIQGCLKFPGSMTLMQNPSDRSTIYCRTCTPEDWKFRRTKLPCNFPHAARR